MSEMTSVVTTIQRTALVTGATGFVGTHLVRRLVRDGWQVHIISRSDSHFPDMPEFTQVTNHMHDGSTAGMMSCIAQAKPDVVFHLASLFLSQHAPNDIEPLITSNLLFGNQLLEAMKINGATSIVSTGTSWQHYKNEDYNPVCLYAATKQAFEAILDYYVQACNFKVITLKLFDTYGIDDPRPKLFNLLIKAATTGEALNMSAGEQLIDLVHIDDVSWAYLLAAEKLMKHETSIHEKYSVSSGFPVPLKDVVNKYIDHYKLTTQINWDARPYRFREVMEPWNAGRRLPNWIPRKFNGSLNP